MPPKHHSGTAQRLSSGRYRARIWDKTTAKQISLGTFDTEEEALACAEAFYARPVVKARRTMADEEVIRFLGQLSVEERRMIWAVLDNDPYLWDSEYPRPSPGDQFS